MTHGPVIARENGLLSWAWSGTDGYVEILSSAAAGGYLRFRMSGEISFRNEGSCERTA